MGRRRLPPWHDGLKGPGWGQPGWQPRIAPGLSRTTDKASPLPTPGSRSPGAHAAQGPLSHPSCFLPRAFTVLFSQLNSLPPFRWQQCCPGEPGNPRTGLTRHHTHASPWGLLSSPVSWAPLCCFVGVSDYHLPPRATGQGRGWVLLPIISPVPSRSLLSKEMDE